MCIYMNTWVYTSVREHIKKKAVQWHSCESQVLGEETGSIQELHTHTYNVICA